VCRSRRSIYKSPYRNKIYIYIEVLGIDHLDLHTYDFKEECMNEKEIERKLVMMVKSASGIAPKFVSPGFSGMPDRLILMPDGHMAFAELKAPGQRPRPLQLSRHHLLRKLGYKVYVIDDVIEIGGMLYELQTL
jgi:hypothetical protein